MRTVCTVTSKAKEMYPVLNCEHESTSYPTSHLYLVLESQKLVSLMMIKHFSQAWRKKKNRDRPQSLVSKTHTWARKEGVQCLMSQVQCVIMLSLL